MGSRRTESVKRYQKNIKWNRAEHYAFLKRVVQAIRKGHKKGSSLDKQGWDLVISLLKRKDNIIADKSMLKNHFDTSRMLWRGWTELRETPGLVWNPIVHTYIAAESVWEDFLKRHRICRRLKQWGYDEEAEANLSTIFGKKQTTGQDGMPDSSGNVPPTETPQELPVRVDECAENMQATSPTLDNDSSSENRGDEASPTTEHELFGSTRQLPLPSLPNTSTSPSFSRPTTSPSTSDRATRKRMSPGEVTSAGRKIALSMKKRKAIAREPTHSASIEDIEVKQYKKCIALLKALPGYTLADPMYTDAASYFLKKSVRCLWLAMDDHAKFREKWLHSYWLEHRSV